MLFRSAAEQFFANFFIEIAGSCSKCGAACYFIKILCGKLIFLIECSLAKVSSLE